MSHTLHYPGRMGLWEGFNVTITPDDAHYTSVAVDKNIPSHHHGLNPCNVEMMHLQWGILKPGIIAHYDQEICVRCVVFGIHLLTEAFIAYQYTDMCFSGRDHLRQRAREDIVVSAGSEKRKNRRHPAVDRLFEEIEEDCLVVPVCYPPIILDEIC